MTISITPTAYGHLVVVGDWRFSFVKKEESEAFQSGPYAGPYISDPRARWSAETQAKRAMLTAGHMVVV